MSRWFRSLLIALVAVPLVLLLHPDFSQAQSIWMPRDQENALLLEVFQPSLELIEESFPTLGLFLGARYSLGSHISLVGEVPFATFNGNFELYISDPHRSESVLGNPYLGLEVHGTNSPFFGEFGLRPPLADRDKFGALITGFACDVTRWDAFLSGIFYPTFSKMLSVRALANFREVSDSGVATRLRVGPAVLIPTDDEANLDTELYGIYAWQIGYEGRSLRVGGALSGRILVTEDFGNLGERSTNQFEFHADFGSWPVRPGVELKLPLANAADLVPVVVGVSVSAGL